MFSIFEYSAHKPLKGERRETASWQSDHFVVRSGRQGRNPAGESPAMPVARFRHVAIPQFVMGNQHDQCVV